MKGQTLSKAERDMIMKAATHYADSLYVTNSNHPSGAVAMPTTDPNWDYSTSEGTWQ